MEVEILSWRSLPAKKKPIPTSTATFARFLELPRELQYQVWKHATYSAWENCLCLVYFSAYKTWSCIPCLQGPYRRQVIFIKDSAYGAFQRILKNSHACSVARVLAFNWVRKTLQDEYREFNECMDCTRLTVFMWSLSEVFNGLVDQMRHGTMILKETSQLHQRGTSRGRRILHQQRTFHD